MSSDWPNELDAVVAAPKHHQVLLETNHVRVLETVVEPGEIVPLHTHRWPAVTTFLSMSNVVRRDADGNVLFASAPEHDAQHSGTESVMTPPLPPHMLENVGSRRLHVITVELKEVPEANAG